MTWWVLLGLATFVIAVSGAWEALFWFVAIAGTLFVATRVGYWIQDRDQRR